MSNERPVLLFYCQHSVGMGHLKRAFNLADALAEWFHVVFLNGGKFPHGVEAPAGIEVVELPPLGMNGDNRLYSQDSRYNVAEAMQLRRTRIQAVAESCRPEVVMVELFPFGRKKFTGEILALLRAVRSQIVPPLIVCSLRDIMVSARKDQLRHDNRARWLTDRYFDAVLVHSDPLLAKLEDSFAPDKPLRTAVYYTGYVTPPAPTSENGDSRRGVLVSAGGGLVGGRLFRAAVAAQRLLWRRRQLLMTLVAGPFLSEDEWQALLRQAENCPGLTLLRSVPALHELYGGHRVSVSQAGYNTVMDILTANIPALVVPFAEGLEDEQSRRADKLEGLGLLRQLKSERLNGERLAGEIERLFDFQPKGSGIDLGGAANTVSIVRRLHVCRRYAQRHSSGAPAEAGHA